MAKNERNMLRAGVGSLISRQSNDVQLVNRAGRPAKDAGKGSGRWAKNRNITTSLVMDKEQHNQIKKLANKTGNTFKETMYLLLQDSLNRYESGELQIPGPFDES